MPRVRSGGHCRLGVPIAQFDRRFQLKLVLRVRVVALRPCAGPDSVPRPLRAPVPSATERPDSLDDGEQKGRR
jgi:hypothetical protein